MEKQKTSRPEKKHRRKTITTRVLEDYCDFLDEVFIAEGVPDNPDLKFDYRLKAWGFIAVFLKRYGWKIIRNEKWRADIERPPLTFGSNEFMKTVCSLSGAPEETGSQPPIPTSLQAEKPPASQLQEPTVPEATEHSRAKEK